MDMWILIEEAINVYLQFFFYKQNNEIGSHCEFPPPPKDHDYIYIYIVDEINTTAFNYTVFSHLKIPKR